MFYNDLFDLVDEVFTLPNSMSVKSDSQAKYSVPSFPPVNVAVEEDGSMKFEFALAGYVKDSIKIDFDENKLIVSTVEDYKAPEASEKEKVLVQKIKKPSFKYSYFVPETKFVFANTVAKLEDGILTVNIPPVEKKERPKVTIN